MRKVIATLLLGSSLFAIAPKRSEAIVGISTGNLPLIVIGGAMTASCLAAYKDFQHGNQKVIHALALPCEAPAYAIGTLTSSSGYGGMATVILSTLMTSIVSVVLLDNDKQSANFQEIDLAKHSELGVTEDDLIEYNSDIESLTLINQSILSEAKVIKDSDKQSEFILSKWNDALSDLNPGTINVLSQGAISK